MSNVPEHKPSHRIRWTSWIWAGHQVWICVECDSFGRKRSFIKKYATPTWTQVSPEKEKTTEEIWEVILST